MGHKGSFWKNEPNFINENGGGAVAKAKRKTSWFTLLTKTA
jgi:hypothetical protein